MNTQAGNTADKQVVVVTGAARSIGAAIALSLADGASAVAVHYRSRGDEAEQVASAVRERGADVLTIASDLTDAGAAEDLFQQVTDRWGRVDVVVANAGVPNPGVDVLNATDEQFRAVLNVNSVATYSVLRVAARNLAPRGRLINIGSSSTLFPAVERGLYAASKAAALVLVDALVEHLAERQATANSVVVGPVGDGFLAGRHQEHDSLAAGSPFNRLGTADDIAGVVSFLASDAARWITGQRILVNGGGHL